MEHQDLTQEFGGDTAYSTMGSSFYQVSSCRHTCFSLESLFCQMLISLIWDTETCIPVKKQQLELDMEQWTGSKFGKKYIKAEYCHPADLINMQSTSCKMKARWSTSWNQDYWEKDQQPQICRWHQPCVRKQRGTKDSLDESERGE